MISPCQIGLVRWVLSGLIFSGAALTAAAHFNDGRTERPATLIKAPAGPFKVPPPSFRVSKFHSQYETIPAGPIRELKASDPIPEGLRQ